MSGDDRFILLVLVGHFLKSQEGSLADGVIWKFFS